MVTVPKLCRALLLALVCSASLSILPQAPAVRQAVERGAAAMRGGDAAGAEAAFREAVRLAPGLADIHLDLALVLARQGRLPDAIASMRRAVQLNPRLPSAHMFLGIFLFQTNQPEPARKELLQELAISPENAEALTWLANVDLATGHPERATTSLDKAVALQPDNLDLLELRGKAHSQVARDSYAHMARLDPNSWHVHRVQAQLLADEGKHTEAAAEYSKALQQQQSPDLYEALGDEYRASSSLEGAESAYRKEFELAPGNPVAMYNLGSVQIERGEFEPAIPLLLRMNQVYPGSPVAEYYLGRGLAASGRDAEATTWLQRAATDDHDGEIAKRSWFELARVYRRTKQADQAQHASAEYNRLREAQEKQSAEQVQDWKKLQQPAQASQ